MATGIYLIDNPPATRQFRSPRREAPSGVVVVHTAESFADETPPDRGAENVAAFIARRSNPGSYHDLADSDSIIQLVRYSDEAFHDATGSNPHSYGVSAAAQAAKWPDYSPEWRKATVTNMARAAARYARWLYDRRGIIIPARRISRADSEDRTPGFISHALRDPDRRTDPGPHFPWPFFLTQYAHIIAFGEVEDMELTDNLSLSGSTQALIGAPTASVDNALENGLIGGVNSKTILPIVRSIQTDVAALHAKLDSLPSTPEGFAALVAAAVADVLKERLES